MKRRILISVAEYESWQVGQLVWFGGYHKNRQATIIAGCDSEHCIIRDDKGRDVKKAFKTLFVEK